MTTVTVTIHHNDDARFSRGYEPGDELVEVHRFAVPAAELASAATVERVLADAYRRYNIGECDDAHAYRGVRLEHGRRVDDGSGKAIHHMGRVYGIRSLSMGDVIVVGEVAYTVAAVGFDVVSVVTPGT